MDPAPRPADPRGPTSVVGGLPVSPRQRLRADLEPCGQTAILHVHGEIDAYTLPRWQELLEATVTTLAAEGDRHLIVDLTGTDFVSVRAIMSLAELTTQSCRRRISLALIDSRRYSPTARIIAVAGLSAWLPVHADLTEALAAAKTDPPDLTAATLPRPRARVGPNPRRFPQTPPLCA